MTTVNALSEVAALMGDPARASMLSLLMDGRAHTASELALTAGVTAQTASGHLSRMVEANLLAARAQGRNRFYRLASSDVAHAIESLMALAGIGELPVARALGLDVAGLGQRVGDGDADLARQVIVAGAAEAQVGIAPPGGVH